STLGKLEFSTDALFSVMGRHLARALECKLVADAMEGWISQLDLGSPAYADAKVPDTGEGMGLSEAPRGAVGHWLRVEDSKIA
ncbi:MAG: nickel-dependent hydrogenase large subunit, partial [Thermoplasmata archaeon]|nr:nickel-dependent hydrogenase large subunit [Thermoplasmata archaeon]NIY05698.1 nickel-dependent hydrogenase large subunit [Thermoplasmata archaeon]